MASRAAIGEKLRKLGLLLTPDETSPPTIVSRANALAETDPTPVREPFSALLADPILRAAHLDMLQAAPERAIGDVDVPLVVALAKRQDRVVKPDQFPDRGAFYRSDQFSLAKVGVPAAYFGRGTDYVGKPAGWGREQIEKWESTHYHQPSDEYSPDWDLSGAVEDVRLDFLLGVAVADAAQLPTWNPGDEFAGARAKAL